MAPRAYWKGYLKLSLVSCPIALFPAASEREKISFHQLNKNTGHRIKYRKVDAETDLRLRARLEEPEGPQRGEDSPSRREDAAHERAGDRHGDPERRRDERDLLRP